MSLSLSLALSHTRKVHLLAEDRGAVIETIVARTQRYIESSQRMVCARVCVYVSLCVFVLV